jgi:hypothetical protein
MLSITSSRYDPGTLTGFWVKAKALGNLGDSLGSEGAFGVCEIMSNKVSDDADEHTNVCHLPFSTAHVLWQLCND